MTSKKTSEDRKKEKELLEARKAGTIPAEVDEDGKEINPHIPQYMANAPWYLNQEKPSLKHQRSHHITKKDPIGLWYNRGERAGPAPTKYRKGACENCGAMTHKLKDCLERPRRVGAKFSGKDFEADEVITEINVGYDAKHDRWNGYDVSSHAKIAKEYEGVEKERRARKALELEDAVKSKGEAQKEVDEDLKKDDLNDQSEQVEKERNLATTADPRTRTTVRNLRIREDTAKYLLNLDLNSAYYDPKTRSMREAPKPDQGQEDFVYAGDNTALNSGQALDVTTMQVFCWESNDKGVEVHMHGAPTHASRMYANFQARKEQLKEVYRKELLTKYGGEEHLEAPPPELLLGQSEKYVEYTRDGKLLSSGEKAAVRSKYEEDVYPHNHTSIWGSYWEAGHWGYACCRQFVRNSYCLVGRPTGEVQQIQAQSAAEVKRIKEKHDEEARLLAQMQELNAEMAKNPEAPPPAPDPDDEPTKKRKITEDVVELDERKRKYNSGQAETDVTEQEVDSYHRSEVHFEDPMRAFLGKDDEDPL
eukprot:RCo000356